MHIECPNCEALFDEDENTRCPRCQTPVDEPIACGGCGGCNHSHGSGCVGNNDSDDRSSGCDHSHGCGTCGECSRG